MEKRHLIHPIPPVYDHDSRILILGSFPSVKSRQQGFFYGHPQNRFWKVMAAVCEEEVPATVEQKKSFLLRNHIAVWDVIESCEITGSADSSIKNVRPNDLSIILNSAPVSAVFVNGQKAFSLYQRFQQKSLNREAVCLPSTSPANAAWSLSSLTAEWEKQVKEKLR